MKTNNFFRLVIAVSMLVIIGLAGCERDINTLAPAEYPTNGDIFIDGISGGLDYQAFLNTKLDAITIDTDDKYNGESSMRITVPSEGDPAGFFSGGAFVSPGPRDLTGYDAVTFWAKASMVAPFGLAGFGNDNSGSSLYTASRSDITLTTVWQKFVIPIPDARKLGTERGLFQYSVGAFEKNGFYVWLDEIKYEKLGTIAQPRAVFASGTVSGEVGESINAGITGVIYNVNGVDITVNAAPAYFTLVSSDESVATVGADGSINGVSVGSAEITVKLGNVEVGNTITVNVVAPAPRPTTPAPTPTADAADVISMFSNAYSNVPVDTWDTGWEFSTANVEDVQVAGDDVKKYTDLNFVGIEFATQTIDATDMTHFHLDIWTPDPTAAPAAFRVLLVDFGANGVFDGGDDSSHELTFTSPVLSTENWVSLDIPLSNFAGLVNRGHLAQLVLSGDPNTVYVDNVYFYKGEVGPTNEPAVAAPTPTVSASDVISIFSDVYSGVAGTDLNPNWGQATVVSQVSIQGNNTLKYSGLNYQGIQLGSSQNLSGAGKNTLHIDFWTANSTTLNVYLISTGPVETAYVLTVPTTGWTSLDIPLSSFAPVDLADVIQLKFDGDGDIWLDNIYFR